jgi:hypothetical protein
MAVPRREGAAVSVGRGGGDQHPDQEAGQAADQLPKGARSGNGCADEGEEGGEEEVEQ